jgi:hypothetical protein
MVNGLALIRTHEAKDRLTYMFTDGIDITDPWRKVCGYVMPAH